MKRLFGTIGVFLMLAGVAGKSQAQISGLYSTGMAAANTPAGDSTVDTHYTLLTTPAGSAGTAYVTQQHWPIGVWASNTSASRWVSPRANEQIQLDAPGKYTYQTTFNVAGDASQVQITGNVWGDNTVSSVLLNGKVMAIHGIANYQTPASIQLTSGFVTGTNTLQFVVVNGGYVGNPSGFRAELQAGTQAVVITTPPPPPVNNRISWNGIDSYLTGANFPWLNYGTDFGTGAWGKTTDWTHAATLFQTMHSDKINVTRWFVFADGRYSPEFVNPATDSAVTGLDGQFFADVDRMLQIAHDNNIYLIPCLVDFHMFNTRVSSAGVYGGGHYSVFGTPAIRQTYLDNALKPLLQHIAASPYKNYVLAYDIINEPEWNVAGLGAGSNAFPIATMQTFITECANYIHLYGGGAYATAGTAQFKWLYASKNCGLDFYEPHWYPKNSGESLPAYASLGLDKPAIVGEFPATANDYVIGSTAPYSAQWYLDSIYNAGYAGEMAWSFRGVDAQGNWPGCLPVYLNWVNTHAAITGPK